MSIEPVTTEEELEWIRELFAEYAASLGFRQIPASRHNPIAGTYFLELVL